MSKCILIGEELVFYKDNNSNIPHGSTHFHKVGNVIDYYKLGRIESDPELDGSIWEYFWWNGKTWEVDENVQDNNLEKISLHSGWM